MHKIAALNIKRIEYYPIRKLLEVQFQGEEGIYQYFDVPEEIWYNMRNTASVDMYFNIKIAACYRMKCVYKLKNN